MIVRPYAPGDWPAVWAMLAPVFRAGETYAVPRDIGADAARALWTGPDKRVFVAAAEAPGDLLGTYYLKANHAGPGAHVANCGYVVATAAQGRGVARTLCEHSQREAVAAGFTAMQFNLVVASNAGAVALWTKLGFATVGTIPGAFRHPRLGLVAAHVMFKQLAPPRGGPEPG